MDGLEELLQEGIDAIKDIIPFGKDEVSDNDTSTDFADYSFNSGEDALGRLLSSDFSDIQGNEFDTFSNDFTAAMNSAYSELDVSDNGNFGNDFIDSDINTNQADISFTGNGDKHTDDDYNRKAAEEHLKQEEYLRKKGDNRGADAAHSQAEKHIKRIKG